MENAFQPICPFCNLDNSRIIQTNVHAVAIYDGYPISPGHTLIIPKRHIASLFEATRDEQTAMLDLLAVMRAALKNEHNPAVQSPASEPGQ